MDLFSFGQENKLGKNRETFKQCVQRFGACIVTKSLLEGTSHLKWVFRESNGIGTGWVAFGDTDTQEYINNAENLVVVDFSTLMEIEPDVKNIFYMPVGADLEFCCDASGKYFVDTKTGKEIRQPVKHPVQIAFEKNLKFLNQENYEIAFFQNLFSETEKLKIVNIGQADFPTGRIVLADPLAYLGNLKYQTVLEKCIPKGSYVVELCMLCSDFVGTKVAAARLKISEQTSVRYEIAMPKGFQTKDFNQPGVFSFFGVDTGLACFADESITEEYMEFVNTWYQENMDKNIYHDYFAPLFQKDNPNRSNRQIQNHFLLWHLPKSKQRIAMFSSGMGDGIYSAYWGLDQNEEVTELIIPFMNPEFF